MIDLLLSIVCSTAVILIFKAFHRLEVRVFPAIIINYFFCVITGLVALQQSLDFFDGFWLREWFPVGLLVGSSFVAGFYSIALAVQYSGVTAASVASKISLVIPVTVAFFVYGDEVHLPKIMGIALALLAIYFTSRKKEKIDLRTTRALMLPFLVWLISGFIETMLNYSQERLLEPEEFGSFTTFLFGTAGMAGVVVFLGNKIYRRSRPEKATDTTLPKDLKVPVKNPFTLKTLLAGAALGIPNFGSIYFLIHALDHPTLESSVIFPINNIGIVLLSALLAVVLFREKLSRINLLGILIAVVAILLISLGS